MTPKALLVSLVVLLSFSLPASAKHRRHQTSLAAPSCVSDNSGRTLCSEIAQITGKLTSHCPAYLGCGCHLATYLHIAGKRWRELWVARNWAREGTAAAKGCVGCVAVLRRGHGGHVGLVRSYDAHGNPVIYSYANPRLGWTQAPYPASRVISYRTL